MAQYLDKTGVQKLWEKVKGKDEAVLTAAKNDASSKDTALKNELTATINGVNSDVSTLKGYFTSGKANSALKDGDGNVISSTYIKSSLKGVANGLATLDSDGKVPSSQLPSYVDDVIEGYYMSSGEFWKDKSTSSSKVTGAAGVIYVDKDTNKSYRWSGSTYVEISSSLALGETSSTAYAGDKGKTNATNIATLQGYFSSGVAKKATGDKNGNDITTTYSTKANTVKSLSISGKTITVTKGDDTTTTLTTQDTNTTYTAGAGISINSSNAISNTGVIGVSSGSTNGTIYVNTGGTGAEVKVYGLGSAAYTNSSSYATATHNHDSVYAKTGHNHDSVYMSKNATGDDITCSSTANNFEGSSIDEAIGEIDLALRALPTALTTAEIDEICV